MAISFELLETAGTVRESGRSAQAFQLPALAVTRLSAAGSIVMQAATELALARNKGDAIWLRVCKVADNASSPAADNAGSIRLETGDELPFGLPDGANAALYNIRIA